MKNCLIIALGILILLNCTGCRIAGGSQEIRVIGDQPVSTADVESLKNTQADTTSKIPLPSVEKTVTEFIICEIKGYVQKPGVYKLENGSRVSDLIRKAGGIKPEGSLDYINQARKLSDGEAVIVPGQEISRKEFEEMALSEILEQPVSSSKSQENSESGTTVNINEASENELDSVPGIGPVTAGNIIRYREEHGPFQSVEDLKNVDRIGDKTLEKLKIYLTVDP